MPYEVTKVEAFETEFEDGPGKLAAALKPVADAGISVQSVLAWSMQGKGFACVTLAKSTAPEKKKLAAAGFKPYTGAVLLVTGPDKVGGGVEIGTAVGAAGVSMDSMTATVVGGKASALAFFADAKAATKAAAAIKKVGAKKPAAPKKVAAKKAPAKKATAPKKAAPKKAAK